MRKKAITLQDCFEESKRKSRKYFMFFTEFHISLRFFFKSKNLRKKTRFVSRKGFGPSLVAFSQILNLVRINQSYLSRKRKFRNTKL